MVHFLSSGCVLHLDIRNGVQYPGRAIGEALHRKVQMEGETDQIQKMGLGDFLSA